MSLKKSYAVWAIVAGLAFGTTVTAKVTSARAAK